MASAKILQRAETAMEIAEDFLFADDEDDADDDNETCSENADIEDEEKESVSSEHETPADSQEKDDGPKDATSDTDGKKHDEEKKSQKGIGKKIKSLMGVAMRPFGSKLQWKLDFNFEASNRASKKDSANRNNQSHVDNADAGKKTSRIANDGERKHSKITPFDEAEIKRLRMENKRLEKLADKFLDAYIQLKSRIGELSEVEGQLKAAKDSCEKLKAELHDLQTKHECLTVKILKLSDEHRAEVDHIDGELKKTLKELAHLTQEKNAIEENYNKSLQSLKIMNKDLLELSSIRDKLELDLKKQKELHYCEICRLNEKIEKADIEKKEMNDKHHDTILALKQEITNIEVRAKTSDMSNVRLCHQLSDLENEKHALQSSLQDSRAKEIELRRVITVLESNSSTSTSVDADSNGRFSCPLCGQQFDSLANMQLHAEDCCS